MFSRKEKNVTLFYAKNENREDVYGFEEFFDVVKKHRDKIKPLYYESKNKIAEHKTNITNKIDNMEKTLVEIGGAVNGNK